MRGLRLRSILTFLFSGGSLVVLSAIISLSGCGSPPSPPLLRNPADSRSNISLETVRAKDGEYYCRVHQVKLVERAGYRTDLSTTISVGEFVFELAEKFPNAPHISESLTKTDVHTDPHTLIFCPACLEGYQRSAADSCK